MYAAAGDADGEEGAVAPVPRQRGAQRAVLPQLQGPLPRPGIYIYIYIYII